MTNSTFNLDPVVTPTEQSQDIDRATYNQAHPNRIVDIDGRTYEDVLKEMGIETTPDRHYVNNAELYQHMCLYVENRDRAIAQGKPKPPVDDYIGESIMRIATHLSFRPNFIGYSYRQDMIGDAIDNCLTYIDSFDPKKSKNPFSYLTQVCWCAFIRRLKLEKKASIIRGRYMMMTSVSDNVALDRDGDDTAIINNANILHTYMELAQEEENKQKALKEQKKKEREIKKELNRKKTALEGFFDNN